MLCRGKEFYWDFTTFVPPEINLNGVILFTKGLSPSPQFDMLFQPLIGLALIILARNSKMGCKVRNNYSILSPYITPTSVLMKRKKKAARVKMSMD